VKNDAQAVPAASETLIAGLATAATNGVARAACVTVRATPAKVGPADNFA
jgi:hypothetical protein